ncbi:MAG: tetratricopeptide repeat protein, partial [Rhodobacteraceae bacterium]|nr:tetratricopeptide repeat protein [Paracoccaceae bacterium]
VAGVGGYEYYQAQQTAKAREAGAELLAADSAEDAAAAFAALAESGEGGAATLAGLRAAAAQQEAGDIEAAAANYEAIAAKADLPLKFRDLALLKAAMLSLDDGDAQAAADQLAILSEFGRPYRAVALELRAAALLRLDDVDGARAALMEAIAAQEAPQGVQVRAQTLLATLGGPLGEEEGASASPDAASPGAPEEAAQDAQTQ